MDIVRLAQWGTPIFETLTGSRAYGTAIETSDWDYKGIYLQDIDQVLGYKYKEQIEFGKDEVVYEVKRFLQLCSSANPTILEMLFSLQSHWTMCTEYIWFPIRDKRFKFLTKKCAKSFGGYAVEQIKKAKGLDKKINYEKDRITRKTPFDFCYVTLEGKTLPLELWLQRNKLKAEFCGLAAINHFQDCYALYYDYGAEFGPDSNRNVSPKGYRGINIDSGNQPHLSSIPKGEEPVVVMSFNKDAYSQHCNDYHAYQTWLENRNTQRYIDTQTHGQKIDGKNMLHCRRLLDMAIEIATEKTISVCRPNREELLKIRRGEVDLQEMIRKAEEDIVRVDALFESADLPDEVDLALVENLLLEVRHKQLKAK